jgi:hypothetical protein
MRVRAMPFGYDEPEDGPWDRPAYENVPREVEGELERRPSLLGGTVSVVDGVVVDPESIVPVKGDT